MSADDRGSAPVETTFAILFLMLLALGVIQVALSLYARNVVMASAHEGARAAIERGTDDVQAAALARDVVRKASGALVDDLDVDVATSRRGREFRVTVSVGGLIDGLGPLPFPIPVSARASAQTTATAR
jgi:Flp pilus assembly protein TadG